MNKFSVVITTYNSEQTIRQCLESVACADEVVVLDSYSSDKTVEYAQIMGALVKQQDFRGFSQQKKDAVKLAKYDWVLVLDSDEFLSEQAKDALIKWKQQFMDDCVGYQLPRVEWVFWQWSHKWVRHNYFLRFFNRNHMLIADRLVHESFEADGVAYKIAEAFIMHLGEHSISEKIRKINKYSSLAAEQKYREGKRCGMMRLFFYPPFYFFRQYLIKRQLFNGLAGFINSVLNSYYAFLKYAKLYELQKNQD